MPRTLREISKLPKGVVNSNNEVYGKLVKGGVCVSRKQGYKGQYGLKPINCVRKKKYGSE